MAGITSRRVVVAAAVYLAAAWAAVWAVDVWNVAGLRDALVDLQIPHAWYQLFGTGGVTEQLSYFALGATAVVCGVAGGILLASGRRDGGVFWVLVAVAAGLLLIEDAGDTRHVLAAYAEAFAANGEAARRGVVFACLAGLASVPLYAVVRYRRYVWASPARRYLAGAFAFYGAAGLMTATRGVGGQSGWYEPAGRWLMDTVFAGRLLEVPGSGSFSPSSVLMTALIEEPLEFLGAALLLAAAVACWQTVPGRDQEKVPPPSPKSPSRLVPELR